MKTAKLFALATLVVVMICGGCAQKSEISAPRAWAFETEKVWEINRVGNDELMRPGEPRVADDGTLYFRDFERNISYVIDGDGKPVAKFAPQGSGEGEVSFYFNCFPAGDCVAICAPDKIHFFTKQGQFIKAVPNNLFVSFPLAFKNENEYWVAPGALGDTPSDLAAVTHIKLASGDEKIIHEFARFDEEKKPTGGGVVIGLTPQIKMDYDRRSNRIFYGKNSDTLIFSLAGDATQIDSFFFTGTRRPVSEADKRNHFAKADIPEEYMATMLGALPDRMAYYSRIDVVNGLIYMFSAESLSDKTTGQVINVFTPDGRHLYYGKIQVEEGWYIANPDAMQLGHGYVYTVEQNDAEDKRIVKYKIALP